MVLQRLYVPLMEFTMRLRESITNNTVQNATLFGTGASVYAGISNVGLSGTINITGNTN
jgi:phage gpG-like protein